MAQAEQLRPADQLGVLRRFRPVVAGATTTPWAAALSPRDLEVLRLLADGHNTADIAVDLAYSESTIKNIIHDMVRGIGARNRANAVAMAIRAGLI